MARIARPNLELRPFSDDLIPQAAALLAARQARLRQVDPDLPGKYDCCETDWRSADRGVERSLPRLGFRPVAYKLVRHVNARTAWAPGCASTSTG